MPVNVSSLSDLKALFELCREQGCFSFKDGNIEFQLSERLTKPNPRDIIQDVPPEEPIEPGLDPAKAADLKKLREQQMALRSLFNDL